MRCGFACFALAVTLAGGAVTAANAHGQESDIGVKAAFLFNFAKFTEWPRLPAGAPITMCVVDDDDIAAALTAIVRGQSIGGRALDVLRSPDAAAWTTCQLLFLADTESRRASPALRAIRALPILTVSDDAGFAQAGGMIEFYVETGRMRFAINTDAVERSGLRMSSRLLGLAKLVGGTDGR